MVGNLKKKKVGACFFVGVKESKECILKKNKKIKKEEEEGFDPIPSRPLFVHLSFASSCMKSTRVWLFNSNCRKCSITR